jgi:hypothetical protein
MREKLRSLITLAAMPKAKASRDFLLPPPRHLYQLRVSLRYIKPPIWRRFLVPDNWLLGDLHPVLVAVMGWGGYHMHAFSAAASIRPNIPPTRW